jgi:hypothetical protein
MSDEIPENVRVLLREHLTSFERLEIVLLLHADPAQDWNVASISERTRIAREQVIEALQGLEASGLITGVAGKPDVIRYEPSHAGLAEAMKGLDQAYRERRAAVMSEMSINAIQRIRSGTMRAFADSFVFGRKKNDG